MKIALLAGDYIGPEVMRTTVAVLERLSQRYDLKLQFTEAAVGGAAIDAYGSALPTETLKICDQSDAILFGSIGGPKWEDLPPDEQPERAALLPLRRHFHFFANLRPTTIFPMLWNASPLALTAESAARIDFVVVRELTGGIYFAQPKMLDEECGFDTLRYEKEEVVRIARTAFEVAQKRGRKKVTSVDKANVLNSMVCWRRFVSSVALEYPDVTLEHLYVDNAAMQLITNPQQFDVILCPNMFGDILSDEAAVLPGSLGMQASASLGVPHAHAVHAASRESSCYFGLYEPAGGSAPDIAGKDIANPIAQILSAALMFRYSFGRIDLHDALVRAVHDALAGGARTADIATADEKRIGTRQMGETISRML